MLIYAETEPETTAEPKTAPEMVRKYMTSVCEAVYTRGMCPVIWDTPGGFYDRKAYKFSDSELEGIMGIKKLKRN